MRSAIRDDDPVIFIENLALYNVKGEVPEPEDDNDYTVPIGVAEVKREGEDITIVAYSRMTVVALDVARRLEEEGISAEVVDVRSLRPLDRGTIVESVKKTGRAVIIEEDWATFGAGAEIAATIQEGAFDYLDAPVRRVAGVEVPLPYSKVLERAALPSDKHLLRAIRLTLEGALVT
jgi:pyruvate dehydrogenase E1 component beta subunit